MTLRLYFELCLTATLHKPYAREVWYHGADSSPESFDRFYVAMRGPEFSSGFAVGAGVAELELTPRPMSTA